jgi:hypothetical protein
MNIEMIKNDQPGGMNEGKAQYFSALPQALPPQSSARSVQSLFDPRYRRNSRPTRLSHPPIRVRTHWRTIPGARRHGGTVENVSFRPTFHSIFMANDHCGNSIGSNPVSGFWAARCPESGIWSRFRSGGSIHRFIGTRTMAEGERTNLRISRVGIGAQGRVTRSPLVSRASFGRAVGRWWHDPHREFALLELCFHQPARGRA